MGSTPARTSSIADRVTQWSGARHGNDPTSWLSAGRPASSGIFPDSAPVPKRHIGSRAATNPSWPRSSLAARLPIVPVAIADMNPVRGACPIHGPARRPDCSDWTCCRLAVTLWQRVVPWNMFAAGPPDTPRLPTEVLRPTSKEPAACCVHPLTCTVAVADNPQQVRNGRWRPAWPNHSPWLHHARRDDGADSASALEMHRNATPGNAASTPRSSADIPGTDMHVVPADEQPW